MINEKFTKLLIEDKKIVTFMKYWILETKMTTIMNKNHNIIT